MTLTVPEEEGMVAPANRTTIDTCPELLQERVVTGMREVGIPFFRRQYSRRSSLTSADPIYTVNTAILVARSANIAFDPRARKHAHYAALPLEPMGWDSGLRVVIVTSPFTYS